jgi:hypothetical protein
MPETVWGWLLEVFKLVGALGGLFALWDRFGKGRPAVYLVPNDDAHRSRGAMLRVDNLSDEPIAVRAITSRWPQMIKVAETVKELGFVGAMSWHHELVSLLPIPAKEHRTFLLVSQPEAHGSDMPVRIRISWRKLSAPTRRQFPIWFVTTPNQVMEFCEPR